MRDILSLPQDVHSIIWMQLSLQDVIRLFQTCSSFFHSISQDKQLWLHLLHQQAIFTPACIPSNLRDVDEIDASDVRLLVKHAVMLDRAYALPNTNLDVHRIADRPGLGVTWMRLILGRWCIVASADLEQSELSVWDILADGGPRLAATAYVEAPVMDGVIDDSGGQQRCALTIGSSAPYILIIGIYEKNGIIELHQLGMLLTASHVRLFKGNLVGFAVKNGDDAYPHVADWRSGEINQLCIPMNIWDSIPRPPFEPCIAMTIVNGCIFSLHRSAIYVFSGSANKADSRWTHIATMSLAEAIYDGQFMDLSDKPNCGTSQSIIRIYAQSIHSYLQRITIKVQYESNGLLAFALRETSKKSLPGIATRYCFGLSGRRILCQSSFPPHPWATWAYFTISLSPPDDDSESEPFDLFGDYVTVSSGGLPLPHLTSSLEFNDRNGLLLTGTITGDIRLGKFLPFDGILLKSIRTDLPKHSSEDSVVPIDANIFQAKAVPDLPVFYTIRKSCELFSEVPLSLREEVAVLWRDLESGPVNLSGWTNDWLSFNCLWDWIAPFSRWGPAAEDFCESISSVMVRNRLGALGEIIPVIYDADNHKRVVCRIGERLFYCRASRGNDADEEEWDDFEEFFYIDNDMILGILPCTYSEFLSDPSSILPGLADHDTQRNVTRRGWTLPTGLDILCQTAVGIYNMHRCENALFNGPLDDTVVETWSEEEWHRHYSAMIDYFRASRA